MNSKRVLPTADMTGQGVAHSAGQSDSTSQQQRPQSRSVEVERVFGHNDKAMLAALRVILQLPRTPTPLDWEEKKCAV